MKKMKNMFITIFALLVFLVGTTISVSADTATDLSSMKVYAVDASGNKTEVAMNFSPTTYTYDLTVMSNTEKIQIEAVPADSTSKAVIEKEWANTKMDTGMNLTEVSVTSSGGVVQKYTLNTKKLTAEEEATYQSSDTNTDNNDTTTASKNAEDTVVKVENKEMKISSSFSKADIPEGFVKASKKYNGKKYSCIKGEVKNLTAFYLYDDDTEGFYIYDEEKDSFYAMNNIKIKSRMYTIVEPETTDGILENYDKKKITIIDSEVTAWALSEEEGMYLVYAMNWNGDTNLYCYDDNEKCFQRYLVSNDANRQSEAAAKAYDNLEKDYNKLVDKYNMLLKILCGLAVAIIILIFVCINLGLNKKEKKIKNKKDKNQNYTPENYAETESQEMESVIQEGTPEEEIREMEDVESFEEIQEALTLNIETGEPEKSEDLEEIESDEEDEEEDSSNSQIFNVDMTRTYGDEPTFGSELESNEGFYGGEDDEDGEVFIDITDEEPEISKEEQIENDIKEAEQETEEDIKETLKSMLPDDDDDDFEFIDID